MTETNRGIQKLLDGKRLSDRDFSDILSAQNEETAALIAKEADKVRLSIYGNDVYVRGLIEFSNYCKNDCYYCGLRRSNCNINRYRLDEDEILECCQTGYELGFRTFVLQSGEDGAYNPERIAALVSRIKSQYPDCAVTLSVGEATRAVYKLWFDAGADRYLLRHETADPEHYGLLHPDEMSFENRIRCLYDLRDIGFAVGCGMMVGSPGQTLNTLAKDLAFLYDFRPDMVGIGPFIPQHDTPFGQKTAGTLEQTLYLLSVIRLILPDVLLPATTALGTIHPFGRELGIKAGANVCMPNLSPVKFRKEYALYDNKICTGDEAAECRYCLENRMKNIGYNVVVSRGDRIKTASEKS